MAINLRSPYRLSTNVAATSYGTLAISIWEGSSASPVTAQYNLRKDLVGAYLTFEISELVRDYLEIAFNGDYNGQAVWVRTVHNVFNVSDVNIYTNTTTQIALDSYSYFEEPSFSIDSSSLLISNRDVFVLADNIFRIPVYTADNPTIIFIKDNEVVYSQALVSTVQSATQIEYISILGDSSNWDNYKERVLADGGVYENSSCLKAVFDGFEIGAVDTIHISNSSGLEIIKIKTVEECKYEPKKVTFVNKFGALQDMYFFKKSAEDLRVKRKSYQSNILTNGGGYSTSSHVNRDYNVSGSESITMNSGYLNESYNEVFKQLLLSEQVWMTEVTDTGELVTPVNISTSGITYKTSVNDKLVDYKISFDKSFETINNIR